MAGSGIEKKTDPSQPSPFLVGVGVVSVQAGSMLGVGRSKALGPGYCYPSTPVGSWQPE